MLRKTKTRQRTGAVTVEVAITAPILFLFVFAGIEFARVNMISDTCENAAFEGARRGIVPGATATDCQNEAQQILDIVGITDSTKAARPGNLGSHRVTYHLNNDITISGPASVMENGAHFRVKKLASGTYKFTVKAASYTHHRRD